MRQNIYDTTEFFEEYQKIRQSQHNLNQLIEEPALLSLLPEMKQRSVLDLGCGAGNIARVLAQRGVSSYTGCDISENMIALAKKEFGDKWQFLQLAMEDLPELVAQNRRYDVVTSSLAFHYVADFDVLLANIYQLLNEDGHLVFSQEHPLVTCHDQVMGDRWIRNAQQQKLFAKVGDYSISGKRTVAWLGEEVIKYHRPFSVIVNALVQQGFVIEEILEPFSEEYEDTVDTLIRPDFLLIRARKVG